ncbi:MAG: geranyl transferase [Gammaproteobacteria bacterium]|nr:geranyl transferase [Gammaproteobacteria bacterium]
MNNLNLDEAALSAALKSCQARVQEVLAQCLPGESAYLERLHQAMRYAVLNGGKRVRAALVYLTGQALAGQALADRTIKNSEGSRSPGPNGVYLDRAAAAVELIHAYSLVHDDLPCMDDDALRRGVPTCHIKFNEATAMLAGDALQTLAFELLAGDGLERHPNAAEMVAVLAKASGAAGMAGGQAIDLAAVGKALTLTELQTMHELKTGALIRGAVRLGALCTSAPGDARIEPLDRYAYRIGLAFQIQDDILDVEGDTTTLGKRQGADEALDKPTYPALLGLEEAKSMAFTMHEEAIKALQGFDSRADPLRWLSAFIIARTH